MALDGLQDPTFTSMERVLGKHANDTSPQNPLGSAPVQGCQEPLSVNQALVQALRHRGSTYQGLTSNQSSF